MLANGLSLNSTQRAADNAELSLKNKIQLEKSLNFVSEKDQVGPTTDLFFHELTEKESRPKRYFEIFGAVLGSALFMLVLPVLAPLMLVTSGFPIFTEEKFVGYRGRHFSRYFLRTHKTPAKKVKTLLGNFLLKTGLYLLPNLLNVFRGEMALVGPTPLRPENSEKLNKFYTDFYKRYAAKPGIIATREETSWHVDKPREQLVRNLRTDLTYLVYPTLKKDIKIINEALMNGRSRKNGQHKKRKQRQ
ncbi:MAG: sugar transferase [Balneolaceae bacterium]|nr:sugar transferase [Balneolaceae bacterium]